MHTGRRLVYLAQFDPVAWIDVVQREQITHCMLVPTMIERIVRVLVERGERVPSLRHMTYGGGRMPAGLVERTMAVMPEVQLLNNYGLTETSSALSILGPKDHRVAAASDDPAVRARLRSVGRPIRSVELQIRDEVGREVPPGTRGEIWVRGAQVSGEYLGAGVRLTADGWLATRDAGWIDDGGYLFVDGRLDDVIIRGGENIAPEEIEDVLVGHPEVAEAAVVGVPDEEWGEVVAAAVVLVPGASVDEAVLQAWVRDRLRSARTPVRISVRAELPYSDTGKLLRRVLRAELGGAV
jgi:acyl-CoA synthetase (AMP-forming)/AMP-acid ligase II